VHSAKPLKEELLGRVRALSLDYQNKCKFLKGFSGNSPDQTPRKARKHEKPKTAPSKDKQSN
jgi:hypothetical protein